MYTYKALNDSKKINTVANNQIVLEQRSVGRGLLLHPSFIIINKLLQ
jgi:hypothetical protein